MFLSGIIMVNDTSPVMTLEGTINGLTLSDITADLRDGPSGTPGGRVFTTNSGSTITGLQMSDCNIRAADTVFDFQGSVEGRIPDVQVDESNIAATIYGATSNVAFGPNMPPFDAPPTHQVGSVVLASPSWDPDGDNNGEWVMSDGTVWQKVVDLPNYT
jgi:hypothetical protein